MKTQEQPTHANPRVKVEEHGGQTEASFYYTGRPSWRVYGEGFTQGKIHGQCDGSLYCIVSENSENEDTGRITTKEVYFTLPAEIVKMIKDGKLDRVNDRRKSNTQHW